MKPVLSQQNGIALPLAILLAASGCMSSTPVQRATEPVRVTNAGQPFQMWDGAAARQVADAQCGPRGVRSSIYDRYDRSTGEWVYPGGCA
jgi:hypothetical protein